MSTFLTNHSTSYLFPSSQKGADVRDIFSCVALPFPLQEHCHIDGQVNDFSIEANIVVAKDNGLRDIILCVAQDIVQCHPVLIPAIWETKRLTNFFHVFILQ